MDLLDKLLTKLRFVSIKPPSVALHTKAATKGGWFGAAKRKWRLLFQKTRLSPLEKSYSSGFERHTELAEYYASLASVAFSLKKYDEAIRGYQDAVKLKPARGEWLFGLGRAYQAQGDRSKAEKNYKQALSIYPGYSECLYHQGKLYLAEKRYIESMESFTRCTDVSTIDAHPYHESLGKAYLGLSNYARAREEFLQAVTRSPNQHALLFQLGLLEIKMGKEQKASGYLRRAVELAPKVPAYNFHAAALLYKSGELIDALRYITNAITISPNKAVYYNKLGQIATQLFSLERKKAATESECHGKLISPDRHYGERAKNAYLKAYSISPTAQFSHVLAVSEANLGDWPRAKKYFAEALKRAPNNLNWATEYAYYLFEYGEWEKGYAIVSEIVKKHFSTPEALSSVAPWLYKFKKYAQLIIQKTYACPDTRMAGVFMSINYRKKNPELFYNRLYYSLFNTINPSICLCYFSRAFAGTILHVEGAYGKERLLELVQKFRSLLTWETVYNISIELYFKGYEDAARQIFHTFIGVVPAIDVKTEVKAKPLNFYQFLEGKAARTPLRALTGALAILDFSSLEKEETPPFGNYIESMSLLACIAKLDGVTFEPIPFDTSNKSELSALREFGLQLQKGKGTDNRADRFLPLHLFTVNRGLPSAGSYPASTWLIVCGSLLEYSFGKNCDFPFPEEIHPIFLSVRIEDGYLLTDKIVRYLQKYQPIGCKDWITVYRLRDQGIEAFFSGCITSTLTSTSDKRDNLHDRQQYLIDYQDACGEFFAESSARRISLHELSSNKCVVAMRNAVNLVNSFEDASKVITSDVTCYTAAVALRCDVDFRMKNKVDTSIVGLFPISYEDLVKLRLGFEKKLAALVAHISANDSEETIYGAWRGLCKEDIDFTNAFCEDAMPQPLPSFNVKKACENVQNNMQAYNESVRTLQNCVHLAFSLDDNLTPYLPTVINSILSNTQRPISFSLLTRKISSLYCEALAKRFPQSAFYFYPMDSFNYLTESGGGNRIPDSGKDKMVLPGIIIHCDKIVYIDVDVLVLGDIGELYDTALSEFPIAVALEETGVNMQPHTGLERELFKKSYSEIIDLRKYLSSKGTLNFVHANSGVILFDCGTLRKTNYCDEIVSLFQQFKMDDQSVLNAYTRTNRILLDPVWNYIVPSSSPVWAYDKIRSTEPTPKLLHFTTYMKPWVEAFVWYKEYWEKYAIVDFEWKSEISQPAFTAKTDVTTVESVEGEDSPRVIAGAFASEAETALAKLNFKTAEFYYSQALAKAPDNLEWRFTHNIIQQYLERGQGKVAKQPSHKKYTGPGSKYYLQAQNAMKKGDLPNALAAIKLSLELAPTKALYYATSGEIYSLMGRRAMASIAYEAALEFEPQNILWLLTLGKLNLSLGKKVKAEKCFREVQVLDPLNVEALRQLGEILSAKRKFSEAAKYYDLACGACTTNAQLFESAARAHWRLHKLISTDLVRQSAIAGTPLQISEEHLSQAIEYYRRALDLNPKNPHCHIYLGLCEKDAGNRKRAEKHMWFAIALAPQNIDIHIYYFRALFEWGEWDRAFPQLLSTMGNRFSLPGDYSHVLAWLRKLRKYFIPVARNLLIIPEYAELGALCIATFNPDPCYYIGRVYPMAQRCSQKTCMDIMPREYSGAAFALEGRAAEKKFFDLLQEQFNEFLGSSWLCVAEQAYGAGYKHLAMDIANALWDSREHQKNLTEASSKVLAWFHSRLKKELTDKNNEVSSAMIPTLGVIGYRQINMSNSSSYLGDFNLSLAFLGMLARLGHKYRTHDGSLEELLCLFVGYDQESSSSDRKLIQLVEVNKDYPSGSSYPTPTWLFVYGSFFFPTFNKHYDFPFPEEIRPVFLAFELHNHCLLTEAMKGYLRKYGPIGCRNWSTVYRLRNEGIQAFFAGCPSFTLRKTFAGKYPQSKRDLLFIDFADYHGRFTDRVCEVKTMNSAAKEAHLLSNLQKSHTLLLDIASSEKTITDNLDCYLAARALNKDVEFMPSQPENLQLEGLYPLSESDLLFGANWLEETVETLVDYIIAGKKDEEIYIAWKKLCEDQLEKAQSYCASYPELPCTTFSLDDTIAAIRDDKRSYALSERTILQSAVSLGTCNERSCADIHLSFCVDQNMAPYLPTVVNSILGNTNRRVSFAILTRGLCEDYTRSLAEAFPQSSFESYAVDAVQYAFYSAGRPEVTNSARDKLLLPDILVDVPRTVFLDVDLLVLDDIGELFDIDLDEHAIAAAHDISAGSQHGYELFERDLYKNAPTAIGSIRRHLYETGSLDFVGINSGVLVMDLDRMRQDNFCSRFIPYVEAFKLNDQSVFNAYLRENKLILPSEWNYVVYAMYPREGYSINGTTVLEKPKIIHFAGGQKPWDNPYTTFQDIWKYWEYPNFTWPSRVTGIRSES